MLEQQLNAKPKLELDIKQLEGKLAEMKLVPAEQDSETKRKQMDLVRSCKASMMKWMLWNHLFKLCLLRKEQATMSCKMVGRS